MLTEIDSNRETTSFTLQEYLPQVAYNANREELARVTALGGEGLMLRKPKSNYERTRSTTLLKVKKFLDTEVTVTSYEAGKGRHKGRVGALWVRLGDGKECKVGTGLKDKDRDSPPAGVHVGRAADGAVAYQTGPASWARAQA